MRARKSTPPVYVETPVSGRFPFLIPFCPSIPFWGAIDIADHTDKLNPGTMTNHPGRTFCTGGLLPRV